MTREDKEKVIELIDNKITEFIRKSPIRKSEGVCNLGLEISEQIEALPVEECQRCKEIEKELNKYRVHHGMGTILD